MNKINSYLYQVIDCLFNKQALFQIPSVAVRLCVKFQNEWEVLDLNHAASRLHEILRPDVRPLSEQRPWIIDDVDMSHLCFNFQICISAWKNSRPFNTKACLILSPNWDRNTKNYILQLPFPNGVQRMHFNAFSTDDLETHWAWASTDWYCLSCPEYSVSSIPG